MRLQDGRYEFQSRGRVAMPQTSKNSALIGEALDQLTTPALVLDLPAFERNLAEMARRAGSASRALRPHAKGPKCPEVAKRQIASGACGIACATLFEAETLADAGVGRLLLTSPIAGAARIDRLLALNARVDGGVCAVADASDAVDAVAAAAARAGRKLRVLVDVDVGQKRTGATSMEAAVALAQQIARSPALEFKGVQAYYGHLQGIVSHDERQFACNKALSQVADLLERMRRSGVAAEIVTGGGTGTCAIDLDAGVFSEIQPGSYPFMDSAYAAVEIEKGRSVFEPSLFVDADVVSANIDGQATLNAGMKAVPVDGAPVRVVAGAPDDSSYRIAGDEFGIVAWKDGSRRLAVGDRVRLLTGHCDTTCNLHAELVVVKDDRIVDIWPISARGRW
jgi:3-hydroxy-D-aspartate aldolase